MYCPEKLKINRFKDVQIPSPTEFVQRYGLRAAPDSYSGENLAVPPMSKIEQLNLAEKINSRALDREFQRRQESLAKANQPAPEPTPEPTPAS